MAKVINILYHDGAWGMRRPQHAGHPAATMEKLTTANVMLGFGEDDEDDAVRAARVGAMLEAAQPTMITLQEVTEAQRDAVMALKWVQRSYALTELDLVPERRFGSMVLWRFALPVQMAEVLPARAGTAGPRWPAVVVSMRQFCGGPCSIIAAQVDPALNAQERSAQINHWIARVPSPEGATVMLSFNPYHATGPLPRLGAMREGLTNANFEEICDAGAAAVWVFGRRLTMSGRVQKITADPDAPSTSYRSAVMATLVASSAASPAGAAPETPERQKQPAFPSSPPPEGSSPSSANKKRQWSYKHSCTIRVRDGTEEQHYDLSAFYARPDDLLKALNAQAFAWPVDYAICHGRLVAAHGTNADLPSFRTYMQSHAAPRGVTPHGTAAEKGVKKALPGIVTNITPTPINVGSAVGGLNFGPNMLAVATLAASRRRVWSAARAIIIFQVTPREMLFDITQLVGVGRGMRQQAVDRLNGIAQKPKKLLGTPAADDGASPPPDALVSYRHDYAMLYSSERQGYWLLAAVDVPCDIAACRMAAKTLHGTPVAESL
jgi:hypothetical protein